MTVSCAASLPWDTYAVTNPSRLLFAVRLGTAAVWLVFGLVFKVLNLVPRHETIVATVVGNDWARSATVAIGLGEMLLGLWILSARWPLLCAATQTAAIIGMNALEIMLAREHLLSPVGMVCANGVFLGLGWFLAVRTARRQAGT